MVLIRVDFPQPFGPNTATCSFRFMRRLKSSRAVFAPLAAFPRMTQMFCKSSSGIWARDGFEFANFKFILLSQTCNKPATSSRYLSVSCPSNREGSSGRPWGAPGCPFLFSLGILSLGRAGAWLLQIRTHDIDEFVSRQRLLRTDLLLLIDDVEADVTLQQFRHQSIHGAPRRSVQLKYIGAIFIRLQRAFYGRDLAFNSLDSENELGFPFNRMHGFASQ